MKISVLSVSNRQNGLDMVKRCLDRQTFDDFEWIIVSPLKLDLPNVVPDPPKSTPYWNLNACYNAGIKKCKGELIVSIQDFIWFEPTALEKFWFNYKAVGPKACISGVGDIYKDIENGKPENIIWNDPRKRNNVGGFSECNAIDIEFNFSAIPRQAYYDIGGCDEVLDNKGYDPVNLNVCYRLEMLGYKFYLDHTNECRGWRHEAHPRDWDSNLTFLNGSQNERLKDYRTNGVKLNYLTI